MSSIEFDCPSCGERLPNPGALRCPSCGEPLRGEDLHLGSAFDRRRRGIDLSASLRTLLSFYLHPFGTFRSMRPEGRALDALGYAIIVGVPPLALFALGLALGGRATFGRAAIAIASSPVAIAVGLGAWSAAIHLVLSLTGRGRRAFSATFRAMAFSLGSSLVLWLVPYAGPFLGAGAFLWFQLVGVKELHRIRFSDALLSVLVPAAILTAAALFLALFTLAYLLGEKVGGRGGAP